MFTRLKFAFLVFFLVGCSTPHVNRCTHFTGWAMTIPYHITCGKNISGEEQIIVSKIVEETFAEIHTTVNNWNDESEISLFNQAQANTPQKVSAHLINLIDLSQTIAALSNGLFDPTIEPLSKLWKSALNKGATPDQKELELVMREVGWNHIHKQEQSVWKDRSGTRLDFCALSKGYCVDLILERLCEIGYKDLIVEWGGEIRASGRHPDGRDWMVEVEPARLSVPLSNQAIATSGDYATDEWGNGFFHIIHPKTCRPLQKKQGSISATTVIAPTCALADAIATTLMLFETKEEAENWAQQIPEVKFWIFTR